MSRALLLLLLVLLLWQPAYSATLTKGKTFTASEEVTNTKLHQLVDSGTVTNITQADVAGGEGIVRRNTTAPSDVDQLWTDTSFTKPILKASDGTNWQSVDYCHVRLTNQSGATRNAGDVVIVDSSNNSAFTTTTTSSHDNVIGIVLEQITAASTGLVAVCGGAYTVNVAAAVTRGNFLITTTTAGQADDVAALEDGIFAVAITSSAGAGTVQAIMRSR
jgi:hypothetical protein